MGFDWTVLSSCVSAAAAVVALFLSGRQIRLSNKQALFDRRISIWLVTKGLLELYRKSEHNLATRNEGPQFALDQDYAWLTNNTFLCEVGPAANHPLEAEYQKLLLIKLEELKRLALEARLVFKGSPSEAISGFLLDYQELLFAIYRYQILIVNVKKNAGQFNWSLERSCEEVGEPARREELFVAFDAVAASYGVLNEDKMLATVERQIRLAR